MKKILCLVLLVSLYAEKGISQTNKLWSINSIERLEDKEKVKRSTLPTSFEIYTLNFQAFRTQLQGAPLVDSQTTSSVVVTFPDCDGNLEQYRVYEAPLFAPEMQALYPEIRSYAAQGIENPSSIVRFSVSPQKGLSAMIRSGKNGVTIIDPYTTDYNHYLVFNKKYSNTSKVGFVCATPEDEAVHFGSKLINDMALLNNADDNIKRTFDLALSVTAEYSIFHGGTLASVNAAINATMTRVNGVFENDMNLTMVLVPNNDVLIFFNPATDPYASATNIGQWNNQLQTTLNNLIGINNYDIGHLFGQDGGGGNAGCIGCVCDAQKGRGITSPIDGIPQGDTYDIDFVAHEMGHQYGATHTFSHQLEGSGSNMEPGSGTTIMGYAGITGPTTDVQSNSDAYFHAISIQQITNNIKTKACDVETVIANATPVVDAGANKTIPIGTAFFLTGVASDANAGDQLTYCWEQFNNATSTNLPSPTNTSGPMFRSFDPVSSPTRFFPNFQSVLTNGVQGATWEKVPTVTRNLTFRLTVRDNRPGGASNESDNVIIQFNTNTGPFALTSQSNSGVYWVAGQQQTITWVTNNAQTLPGSANVNIKLSIDNGQTFPYVLASNVPNNGSATITVPETPPALNSCRILIEPTGNTYYAVNARAFSIGYGCDIVSNNTPTAIPDGVGPNNGGDILDHTITSNVSGNIIGDELEVAVDITHPWIGNLTLTLIHPDGTTRTLWNRTCNNPQRSNMNILFKNGSGTIVCASPTVGTYNPLQSFNALTGKPKAGTWTLRARDFVLGNTGTINTFAINFGCTILSNEGFNLSDFSVYPNPSRGIFTVKFDNATSNDVSIAVYDMRGRQIMSKNYPSSDSFEQEVDLTGAQAGVYLLHVEAGENKAVKRIVIQ